MKCYSRLEVFQGGFDTESQAQIIKASSKSFEVRLSRSEAQTVLRAEFYKKIFNTEAHRLEIWEGFTLNWSEK